MSDDRYARVRFSIMDDPKFDGVRERPASLGTWLLCLVVAEMAWPSPALPPLAWIERAEFDALVERGLVDSLPNGTYRIHGLDAERQARSAKGKAASNARWNATSTADAEPVGIPSKEEKEKDKSIPARNGLPHLNSTVAGLWEQVTGRTVMACPAWVQDYLDDGCRRHPAAEVGAAILRARKQFPNIPDAAQMVAAMRPLLDPLPDRKRAAASESDEERRAASRRRVQATKAGIHKLGAHDAAPDPACDMCAAVTA